MMRFVWMVLLSVTIGVIALAAACGKRQIRGNYSGEYGIASITANHVEYIASSSEANGLKVPVFYDYDYSQYPSTRGISVVPMQDDFNPISPGDVEISFRTSESSDEIVAHIESTAKTVIHAHVRYDPTKLEVQGVSGKDVNDGSADFLFLSAIPTPGVLVLYSLQVDHRNTPLSNSTNTFADVIFKPAHRGPSAIDGPPSGVETHKVVWYKNDVDDPPILFTGATQNCLDGQFGKSNSRNGLLNDNEFDKPVPDNCLQDVTLSAFGTTFVLGRDNPHDYLTLRWTERLVGDYDNDGQVSVADLTPLALCYGEADEQFYAQSGVVDRNKVSLIKLPLKMRDFQWLYASNNREIYSYYFFDQEAFPILPGFIRDYSSQGAHGMSHRDNALDGFRDGFIRVYKNHKYNSSNPSPLPEGYFDMPYEKRYHPGDVAPVGIHYLERIDGYKIWTMPSSSNYGQDGNREWHNHTEYPDIVLAKVLERKDYEDRPWLTEAQGVPYMQFRKAELQHSFSTYDFAISPYQQHSGWYDIVIEPFVHGSVAPEDVPTTILRSSARLVEEVDPDPFGPAYFIANPSGAQGIYAVSQPSQYDLFVEYYDADGRDANGQQDEQNKETVQYQLFAYWTEPGYQGDPPDPELLFSNEHMLNNAGWTEENTGVNNGQRNKLLRFQADNLPSRWTGLQQDFLPLDKPGYNIWFGIRARYKGRWEYDSPPHIQEEPNTVISGPLVVHDLTPPHFFAWREYSKSGKVVNIRDFQRVAYGYENAIAIYFHPAYDPPTGDLGSILTYKLYFSDVEFQLPPSPSLLYESKQLAFADHYVDDSLSPYPGLNEEAYQFLVNGLTAGQDYYYYIEAVDSPEYGAPNASLPTRIHSQKPWSGSQWSVPLQTGLPRNTASIGGDIAKHENDIYLLYPTHNLQGYRWPITYIQKGNEYIPLDYPEGDYIFRQLLDGRLDQGVIELEILNSANALPLGFCGGTIAFRLDIIGDPIVQDCVMPIVSYSGSPGPLVPLNPLPNPFGACVSVRTGEGQWQSAYLTADETDDYSKRIGSPTIKSYKYYDGAIQNWGGIHLLPYVYEHRAPLPDPWYNAMRQRYCLGGSTAFNGFTTIIDYEHKVDFWGGFGSDLILKDVDVNPSFGVIWGQTPFSATYNRLYMASSTINYPFSGKVKLWRLTNPFIGWTFLGDVTSALPGLDVNSITLPVSMETIGYRTSGQQYNSEHSIIYLVYNTEVWNGVDQNAQGEMRISYAVDSQNASIPHFQWVGTDYASIIAYNHEYGAGAAGSGPFVDVVDLKVRNLGAKVTEHIYDRLGCAYLDGQNALVLAHTIGTDQDAEWMKLLAYNPVDEYVVDRGDILWLRLEYLEIEGEDIPYIIYARRKSPTEDLYDIMLWRQGGF